MAAPAKQAAATRSEAATKADDLFWAILHGGDYARIDNAQANVVAFNAAAPTTPMMIDSDFACMTCHHD
jgi:hypothetical protein